MFEWLFGYEQKEREEYKYPSMFNMWYSGPLIPPVSQLLSEDDKIKYFNYITKEIFKAEKNSCIIKIKEEYLEDTINSLNALGYNVVKENDNLILRW